MYTCIQFTIRGAQAFDQYARAVSATVQQYGSETIAVNRTPDVLYGHTPADVCVIQKWPSLDAVQQWLDSPAYAPLKTLRDIRDWHLPDEVVLNPVKEESSQLLFKQAA